MCGLLFEYDVRLSVKLYFTKSYMNIRTIGTVLRPCLFCFKVCGEKIHPTENLAPVGLLMLFVCVLFAERIVTELIEKMHADEANYRADKGDKAGHKVDVVVNSRRLLERGELFVIAR